jgi:TPR repeat protein
MRWCYALCLVAGAVLAEPLEEWKPYAKTGLFPADSPLWFAPDMEKEPIPAYTARLLDGARASDAKAMATLGRFFYVRGDVNRAAEWLEKAARAGHGGAQLDYGHLRSRGTNAAADPVEAYAWFWLATWSDIPGADEALQKAAGQLSMGQIIAGIKLAEALRTQK